MNIEFELPFVTPSQNVYQRWFWGKQHSVRDKYIEWLVLRKAQAGLHGYRTQGKVAIEIERHSAGRLDRGNLIGGCKPLLDAMVAVGLLRDDTEGLVEDRYSQHAAKRGHGKMVIRWHELRAAAPAVVPKQLQLG